MAGSVVLQLDPNDANPRNSEGAFISLRSGDTPRIMFAYTRFTGGSGDDGTADIAAVYSDDGGRTWTEPEIIIPNQGTINTMSVSLLRLADGRILLCYLTKSGMEDWKHFNCRPWALFSDDEGKTWSKPELMVSAPGYHVQNNDRIIQLSAENPHAPGRLIAPMSVHRLMEFDPDTEVYRWAQGFVIWCISDDAGASWRECDSWWALPVESGSGLQEPGVVELPDGRIKSWARTDTGYQWGTESRNGGLTWDVFHQLDDFASSCSPLSIKRTPETSFSSTDDLLAVWNDVSGRWDIGEPAEKSWGRTPLCAAVSRDQGETWEHHRLLESDPEHGFAYIAIHFLSAEEAGESEPVVLLGYCAGGEDTKGMLNRLRMRRVPLSWFYGQ
jgi:sialidase-1